jgi:phosphoglycerate dehydrogenase-like enzyme
MASKICVAPFQDDDLLKMLADLGVEVTDRSDVADVLIWLGGSDAEKIFPYLSPTVRWVQTSAAGVERFIASGIIDRDRTWTSAAGAYSSIIAEHAVALLLAGLHRVPEAVRAPYWEEREVAVLAGSSALIIGAGGIGSATAMLLLQFGCRVTAVNRTGHEVAGAELTFSADHIPNLWGTTDHVIICAPATPATVGLVNAQALFKMGRNSWLVNVGRGSIVDSDALADALEKGLIAGAALDVTEPEPLPSDHRLWSSDRLIITSHSANTLRLHQTTLYSFAAENVRRYVENEPLCGVIDLDRGY